MALLLRLAPAMGPGWIGSDLALLRHRMGVATPLLEHALASMSICLMACASMLMLVRSLPDTLNDRTAHAWSTNYPLLVALACSVGWEFAQSLGLAPGSPPTHALQPEQIASDIAGIVLYRSLIGRLLAESVVRRPPTGLTSANPP
jgi:hypothetical protein